MSSIIINEDGSYTESNKQPEATVAPESVCGQLEALLVVTPVETTIEESN